MQLSALWQPSLAGTLEPAAQVTKASCRARELIERTTL
jgi:hypothetical protein